MVKMTIRFLLAVIIIAGTFQIIRLGLKAEAKVNEAQRLNHCRKGYPGACK